MGFAFLLKKRQQKKPAMERGGKIGRGYAVNLFSCSLPFMIPAVLTGHIGLQASILNGE
jgi:hypothetical protein